MAEELCMDPMKIHVAPPDVAALEGIQKFYSIIEREEWKIDHCLDLIETFPQNKVVVYCNTKQKVEWILEQIKTCCIP